MLQFLLDVPPDPTFAEKAKNNIWLIVVAIVAIVGIVGFFVWPNEPKMEGHKIEK